MFAFLRNMWESSACLYGAKGRQLVDLLKFHLDKGQLVGGGDLETFSSGTRDLFLELTATIRRHPNANLYR